MALQCGQTKNAVTAFSTKWYENLAVVVSVPRTTQDLVIHFTDVVILQRTAKKCEAIVLLIKYFV